MPPQKQESFWRTYLSFGKKLTCRNAVLLTMLDAAYVDTVEEKCIVAIRPKPAFMSLFEVATTQAGSGVLLISEKQLPPVDVDQKAASGPCFWWL